MYLFKRLSRPRTLVEYIMSSSVNYDIVIQSTDQLLDIEFQQCHSPILICTWGPRSLHDVRMDCLDANIV